MIAKPDQRPPWISLTIGLMAISVGLAGWPHDWFRFALFVLGFIAVGRYVDGALRWLKERP